QTATSTTPPCGAIPYGRRTAVGAAENVGTFIHKSALHFLKNIISEMIFFCKNLSSDSVKILAPRS
ncbi:MAG: hypothetical protein IJ555_02645, partial [Ruminococcus sp.]|nr:hypothetical protein [Ruminococcus sp.]